MNEGAADGSEGWERQAGTFWSSSEHLYISEAGSVDSGVKGWAELQRAVDRLLPLATTLFPALSPSLSLITSL